MPETTTTLEPIPDLLVSRIADAARETLDVLDRLEAAVRQATRLAQAVEAFAPDDDDERTRWEEASGLDDLWDLMVAIQACVGAYTGSMTEDWDRRQRRAVAARVRQNIAARASRYRED